MSFDSGGSTNSTSRTKMFDNYDLDVLKDDVMDTGRKFPGKTSPSHMNILQMEQLMENVPKNTSTARFSATPNQTRARSWAILTNIGMIPLMSTTCFVAFPKS